MFFLKNLLQLLNIICQEVTENIIHHGYTSVIIVAVYQPNYRVLMSVCLSVCVFASVCVLCLCTQELKNNRPFNLTLEHIEVYGSSSDMFDTGHCLIKVTA